MIAAATPTAITLNTDDTVTIPLALMTAEGLRRVETACRRLRMERIAVQRATDEAEERALERKHTSELSGIAQRLAAGIANGTLA